MKLTIIQKIAIWIIPILFAITLHEVAHGWVASWFGDQTARLSGRLSLNPIHHIDIVGTIFVPLLMLLVSNVIFGWAKPVPVDARNLRHPRRDMALVALAGPLANVVMAILWGGVTKIGWFIESSGNQWWGLPLIYMGGAGIMINAVLAVLNLIPLPPLDGGTLMSSLLPPRAAYLYRRIEPYSFFILIILVFSGLLAPILSQPVYFMIGLISRLYGLG